MASAARCVGRVALPSRVLRFEARVAAVACALMVVFLAACCCWVVTSGHRSGLSQYHAGLIDVVGVAVLTAAFAVALRAASQARHVLRITGS